MRPIALIAAMIILFTCTPSYSSARAPAGLMTIDPQAVEMNLTFAGAIIKVHTEVPAGYEAAIRLMGHPHRQELKKLGKKAGLLWMSAGDIVLENVPLVYQVLSSAPLADMAPSSVLVQWTLGYDGLIPERVLGADMRGEFVRLKEHSGLYAIHEGALSSTKTSCPSKASKHRSEDSSTSSVAPPRQLNGTFQLPASVPAGDYIVDLFGFKDHQAVRLASTPLRVDHTGMVRKLRSFANDHGLAYGITASLIAIVVGILTGFLFRPRSDEAH